MTDEEAQLEGLRRIVDNLQVFSAHCLKVKAKDGSIVPFMWNRAQIYLHEQLEKQLKETGKVRALLLKARQQGGSTYIAARFYHKVTTRMGQSAFIVAHEQKATDNLYSIVKRYHDYNPLAPSTGATNAKELVFDVLQGGYKLATAGSKDVGRSNTVQLLHGSEAAFWANAQQHMAGIGNTVGDQDGSEIILESTANGLGNAFHLQWQAAEAGLSDYIPIFIPWFWQLEYRAPVKPGFSLSSDDELYMKTYGLDMEQMQWRANKIASYGEGYEWLFSQEYPSTAQEAFRSSTKNPLISPLYTSAALLSRIFDDNAPIVIGCDPAGDGASSDDRTAIVFRQGRVVFRVEYHEKLNTMQIAGKLAEYWMHGVEFRGRRVWPDGIVIDKGGLGAGIYDRLQEVNIPVIGIMYGASADDSTLYANKKAEIWHKMLEWFQDEPVRIPNDAQFISDITAPQPDVSSNGRKAIEKKEDLAKRQIRSPDGGDALANTFSVAVTRRIAGADGFRPYVRPSAAGY